MNVHRWATLLLAISMNSLALPGQTPAAKGWSTLVRKSSAPNEVEAFSFDTCSKSIVVVKGLDSSGNTISQGSGVVFQSNVIATNLHVVQGASSILVSQGTRQWSVVRVKLDNDVDLSFLQILDLGLPSVVRGSLEGVKIGDRIYTIGTPKGLEMSLSDGLVSSVRTVDNTQFLQISAPISPGSSGGGVFDQKGKFLGITTFKIQGGENLNFAIPIEKVDELFLRTFWINFSEYYSKFIANEINSAVTEGTSLYEKREFEKMFEIFEKIYIKYPTNEETKINYAKSLCIKCGSLLTLGFVDEAFKYSIKALGVGKYDFTYFTIGAMLHVRKEYHSAINALNESVKINPTYTKAWEQLGKTYFVLNKFQNVKNIFEKLNQYDTVAANKFKQNNISAWK